MEAVRTSETSVDNYFTRQYIPEDNSEHKQGVLPLDNDVRLSFWRWNVVLCSQAKLRLRSYTVFPPFCVLLSPTSSRSSVHRQVSVLLRSVLMAIYCRCLCMGIRPLLIRGSARMTSKRERSPPLTSPALSYTLLITLLPLLLMCFRISDTFQTLVPII
jgi:hypothetical protein